MLTCPIYTGGPPSDVPTREKARVRNMAKVDLGNGQKLEIKLTLGAMRGYERRTGIKLFEVLHRALSSKSGDEAPEKLALRLFASVVPGVEEIGALLYESMVVTAGVPKASFDAFCSGLSIGVLKSTFEAVIEELQEYLPTASQTEKAEANAGGADRPLGR